MRHPDRSLLFSLSALCFAGLAFLGFFHALTMKAVYPHFLPTMQALGFFAALGYVFYLFAGGASCLLVAAYLMPALVGHFQRAGARLFRYLRSSILLEALSCSLLGEQGPR